MYRYFKEIEELDKIRKILSCRREKCNMSKPEFAEFLGVTKKSIYDFEAGKFTSYEMIIKYCFVLCNEEETIKYLNRIKSSFIEDMHTRLT